MQKPADKWQKFIEEKQKTEFKMITVSAIITPVIIG